MFYRKRNESASANMPKSLWAGGFARHQRLLQHRRCTAVGIQQRSLFHFSARADITLPIAICILDDDMCLCSSRFKKRKSKPRQGTHLTTLYRGTMGSIIFTTRYVEKSKQAVVLWYRFASFSIGITSLHCPFSYIVHLYFEAAKNV